MTKSMEWLTAKAPDFCILSKHEQDAIADFTLLWTLFEARILNTKGNAASICNAVEKWRIAGALDAGAFATEIAYFQTRYFVEGAFTYHFGQLHLKAPDREPMVRSVLDGSNSEPSDLIAAMLIIIYRYRNNLFHGVKWEYKLEGQSGNFSAANDALMKILEKYGGLA